jgi:hypothetical protein
MIYSIFTFIKYWSIVELINWLIYLYVYINILTPRYLYFKNKDTDKIIERIDKLTKNEVEYVIKGCIIYDKTLHQDILNPDYIDVKKLSRKEIINIIGYSLFGINLINLCNHSKYYILLDVLNKIENKLEYKFEDRDEDNFLYRKWGSNFIKFTWRPVFLQIPIRILFNTAHLYFIYKLKFNYWVCANTKMSILYKINDPNKKNIIFIHGFGFSYIPYIKILLELEQKYNIIIVILPNISSYRFIDDFVYMYFPPVKNIKESIYNFLKTNKVKESVILSHSFGTYISQILNRDKRNKIFKKIIMVDPIVFWIGCFKMSLNIDNPLVRKNPIHKYISDNLINFLVYQCIYLKYVCYRVMFGPDFWIYNSNEIVNSNLYMVIQKNDNVIPGDVIYDKIKNKSDCFYLDKDDALHGSILMDDQYRPIIHNILDTIYK